MAKTCGPERGRGCSLPITETRDCRPATQTRSFAATTRPPAGGSRRRRRPVDLKGAEGAGLQLYPLQQRLSQKTRAVMVLDLGGTTKEGLLGRGASGAHGFSVAAFPRPRPDEEDGEDLRI